MALIKLWVFLVPIMAFLHLFLYLGALVFFLPLRFTIPLGLSMTYFIITIVVYNKGRIVDQATPLDPTFPHTVIIMSDKRFLQDLKVAGSITAVYVLTFFVTVGIGLWEDMYLVLTVAASLVSMTNTTYLLGVCQEIHKGRFHSPVQETPSTVDTKKKVKPV